ncbi:MAG: DUF72 domain-containing protein [Thermoanaerobaculia bacterium]
MRLFVGTSGFSYKPWKGKFYPEDLPASEWLAYYAARFPTVEINNTFYRVPKPEILEGWAKQVPAEFRFGLKATRRITHIKRLKNVEEETAFFLRAASALGDRLGVVLFQLPPNLKKDLDRLRTFLDLLPGSGRYALEFREPSWLDDEVFTELRARGCALVVSDTDENPLDEIVSTAPFGYLRLRRTDYDDDSLGKWRARIDRQNWEQAWIFFKHEDEGLGPKFALRLLEISPSKPS